MGTLAAIATARFALTTLTVTSFPALAQPDCEKLATAHLSGRTIASATPIPAGPFTLPTGSANAPKVSVPAFCRSKLLSVGNGGLAGTISYAPMVKPLQLGDATSSTDTDHTAHGRQ